MPTFSRLELKPSPREFDLEVFNAYVEELKKDDLRSKLFVCILRGRSFEKIREVNGENHEQAQLEINQCLIEALDFALNSEDVEQEFALFNQKFSVGSSFQSPLKTDNSFLF
jgi:hypothetical protein